MSNRLTDEQVAEQVVCRRGQSCWYVTCLLAQEVQEYRSRRCDGCVHYRAAPSTNSGRCVLSESSITAPVELDTPSPYDVRLLVDANHACNAWEAKL